MASAPLSPGGGHPSDDDLRGRRGGGEGQRRGGGIRPGPVRLRLLLRLLSPSRPLLRVLGQRRVRQGAHLRPAHRQDATGGCPQGGGRGEAPEGEQEQGQKKRHQTVLCGAAGTHAVG